MKSILLNHEICVKCYGHNLGRLYTAIRGLYPDLLPNELFVPDRFSFDGDIPKKSLETLVSEFDALARLSSRYPESGFWDDGRFLIEADLAAYFISRLSIPRWPESVWAQDWAAVSTDPSRPGYYLLDRTSSWQNQPSTRLLRRYLVHENPFFGPARQTRPFAASNSALNSMYSAADDGDSSALKALNWISEHVKLTSDWRDQIRALQNRKQIE